MSATDELPSVAPLWAEALNDRAYELADDEFLDTVVARLTGQVPLRKIHTSATFALTQALLMKITDERLAQRDRLFNALQNNAGRLVDFALDPSRSYGEIDMASALSFACAKGAPEARAPEREILVRVARSAAERFPGLGKSTDFDETIESRLLYGAYAALLSQDLGCLRRIVGLQVELDSAALQWNFLREVASSSTISDDGFLRCQSPELRRRFLNLFQSQRLPFSPQAGAARGGEPWFFGPVRGSYFYAWIYLQSFAPVPTVATDWDVLRELMIG